MCSTVLSSALNEVFHHPSSPGTGASSVGVVSDALAGPRIR